MRGVVGFGQGFKIEYYKIKFKESASIEANIFKIMLRHCLSTEGM